MNEQTRKAILSEDRDLPLLFFLWRWKMATTSALTQRFFAKTSMNGAYLRLWKLKNAGFIRYRTEESGNLFVWILGKKGYAAIRSQLPELQQDGYLSENLRHDLIVSAIHLGDGIFGDIPELEYFTEQELRRIESNLFPKWVPKTTRHRSDGYWQVKTGNGQKIVALEVELSVKQDSEYEKVARFYDDHTEINEVIWIVLKPSIAETIHPLLQSATRREFKHSFVLLDLIYDLGWQVPAFLGHSTQKSIDEILETCPRRSRDLVFCRFSFDIRKTPHKSKHCRFLRDLKYFH